MEEKLVLSTLSKTWIFDLDGTIVKHNGYKIDGEDTLLAGAKEYIDTISKEDKVIIFTSRTDAYREQTIRFLKEHEIRYDDIMFNMPMGERIVINDRKPSGLDMAIGLNVNRDEFKLPQIICEK